MGVDAADHRDVQDDWDYMVTFLDYPSWGSCKVAARDVREDVFKAGNYVQAFLEDSSGEGWYCAKVDGMTADKRGYFVTFDDYPSWGSCEVKGRHVRCDPDCSYSDSDSDS